MRFAQECRGRYTGIDFFLGLLGRQLSHVDDRLCQPCRHQRRRDVVDASVRRQGQEDQEQADHQQRRQGECFSVKMLRDYGTLLVD